MYEFRRYTAECGTTSLSNNMGYDTRYDNCDLNGYDTSYEIGLRVARDHGIKLFVFASWESVSTVLKSIKIQRLRYDESD